MRFATIRALDDAGLDLRIWCYGCGRGADIDSNHWIVFTERGWPIDLAGARDHLRCSACGARGESLLLLPAPRPPGVSDALNLVAWYFHSERNRRKKEKAARRSAASIEPLAELMMRRAPAPLPRPRPKLVLVDREKGRK